MNCNAHFKIVLKMVRFYIKLLFVACLVFLALQFNLIVIYVKENWEYVLWAKHTLMARKYGFKSEVKTVFEEFRDSVNYIEEPCNGLCSYETRVPNEIFKKDYIKHQFLYNDTELFYPLAEQLACLPKTFGYNKEQGDEIFPQMKYPRCSSKVEDPYRNLHLDVNLNKFSMNCTHKTDGKYLLGSPLDRKLVMRREIEHLWELKDYKHELNIEPHHEFAFGTCESDSTKLDRATYNFRKNDTAASIAKENMKKWQSLSGVVSKPMIVFMFVIDSYSRKHFFRKMPRSVEYLNNLNADSDYEVFDFLIHNTYGGNSVANQVPILARNYNTENLTVDDFNPNQDYAGDSGLWNIFREKGFMTYFGFEDCDDSFPRKLGRMPHIDHTCNSSIALFINIQIVVCLKRSSSRGV